MPGEITSTATIFSATQPKYRHIFAEIPVRLRTGARGQWPGRFSGMKWTVAPRLHIVTAFARPLSGGIPGLLRTEIQIRGPVYVAFGQLRAALFKRRD